MPVYRAITNPQNKTFFMGEVDNRTYELNHRGGGVSRTVSKPRLFLRIMDSIGYQLVEDLSDYVLPTKEAR